MARTKAELGQGARLTDYLGVSLLASVFPAERIHEALNAHDCNSQRIRRFPAVAGAYYAIALSLYPEASYEAVFSAVAEGLAWAAGASPPEPVAKSSISELRSRIGAEPLRDLMRSCCVPLADAAQLPQAFYKGLRLVAIDGSRIELADEVEIAQAFGRPGSRTGYAGYPQAQCAVLAECATHAILGAEIGPYRGDEWELCQWLLGALEPGMLCLADRGFNGATQWQQARATGAHLLWRASDNRLLPVRQMLADGSYLSEIEPARQSKRREQISGAPAAASLVRVIEYQLPGAQGPSRYRLITSLLDPQEAPALELAALYHQRWQIEAVFDELKTHLRQGRRVLRSKTAALVRQEFYGWVLAHYAVRWLLHQGAARSGQADEDLSFTAHIQLLKREQPRSGAFPPTAPQKTQSMVAARPARKRAAALRAHA
jgi:Insertion element 4 transposase N-terminal/Transposase DDE domain